MAQDNGRDRFERGNQSQYDQDDFGRGSYQQRGNRQPQQYQDYGQDRYSGGGSQYGSNPSRYGDDDYSSDRYSSSSYGDRQSSDYDRFGGRGSSGMNRSQDRFGGGQYDRDYQSSGGSYGGDRFGQGRDQSADYRSGGSYGSGYGQGYGSQGYGQDYDRGYGSRYGSQGRSYGGSRYDRDSSYRNDSERGFFEKAGDEVASWFGDEDAERRRRMDHRGRGPANYQRSNEKLLEDVCERLTHDPRVDATNINVTADNNEITLDGTVTSRAAKRRAEDCAHDISGVNHVQNNLRVDDSSDRYGGFGSTGTGTGTGTGIGTTSRTDTETT
ncbi:BON domain-containing protein [Qipengyuania spongiae]|uniref:BON domain-containing protein n=1 Tax=Qipengyuania spongiae TaxID=2909673 RepID=A0ABY5T0S0_9SPHN|nr:BON domain-containing protein [Qipengyuania spongiae]UVI40094.1 BON domain-containing protein [Qipengyuania spongiae]